MSYEFILKWENLQKNSTEREGINALLAFTDCIPELFIGIDKDEKKCLILALPQPIKVQLNKIKKEKISIEYFKKSNYIIITLLIDSYSDLFNDLIFSLYNKIKNISNPNKYSNEFINSFFKWSNFFDDNISSRLSDEAIKGLFGELVILKDFIKESESINVNYYLDSWKGPYGNSHDFILNERDIEVKTKELTKLDIHISSEYQLESEAGKKLELQVLSVTFDTIEGLSLFELVNEIKEIVQRKSGEITILFDALMQKGLSLNNLHEYDNFRYSMSNIKVFDCSNPEFPKLVKSNISESIKNLKYNLSLNHLEKFILSETTF